MTRSALSAAAIAGCVATLSVPTATADAQVAACGSREGLLGVLKQRYAETRAAMAVTSQGSLIEILASPSGTWTLLVTVPGEATCVLAEGDGWRDLAEPATQELLRAVPEPRVERPEQGA